MQPPRYHNFSDLAPKGKLMVLGGSGLATVGIFGPLTLLVTGVVPLQIWAVLLCGGTAFACWKAANRHLLQPAKTQLLKFHPSLSPLAPDWAHQWMRDLDRWDGQVPAEFPFSSEQGDVRPRPFDWERD